MGNAGNGFALLRRGGAEQRARGDKQDVAQAALRHVAEDFGAEHRRAAAAAGAACVHVLCRAVKNHQSAVAVPVPHVNALPQEQIAENVAAHLP